MNPNHEDKGTVQDIKKDYVIIKSDSKAAASGYYGWPQVKPILRGVDGGLKVGDRVHLKYQSTGSWGLWFLTDFVLGAEENTYEVSHNNWSDKIKILEIAHHRNGVGGEPFAAIRFKGKDDGGTEREFMAIVFDGDCRTAVICTSLIPELGFGEGNRWRGDVYDQALRQAIKDQDAREEAEFNKRYGGVK